MHQQPNYSTPGADDGEISALPQLISNWKTVAEVALCLDVSEDWVKKAINDRLLQADEEGRIAFNDIVEYLNKEDARHVSRDKAR